MAAKLEEISIYNVDIKRIKERCRVCGLGDDAYAVADMIDWLCDNFLEEAEREHFE